MSEKKEFLVEIHSFGTVSAGMVAEAIEGACIGQSVRVKLFAVHSNPIPDADNPNEPPLQAWKSAVLDALAAWPGMDFKTDTDPALIVAAILRVEREAAADPRLYARAVFDVLAERQRQVDLGWTPEHDDGLVNDEIAAFACYYLMPEGARDWDASSTGYGATLGEAIQPNGFFAAPGSSRRRDLVKAVALGIAEIERLDRAEAAAAAAKGGAA